MTTMNGMRHDEIAKALLAGKIQLLAAELALFENLTKAIAELVSGPAHVFAPLNPKPLRHRAKNLAMPLLQVNQ